MNIDSRAEAWVALQVAGVAPRALLEMLRTFGSPEAVLDATPAQRRAAVASASSPKSLAIAPDPERVAHTLRWLADTPDASLVAWDDADYPAALLEIADPPPVFYCRGRRELLSRPALAIVGSRNATPQGCADAEAFAAALSAAGLTIVSGLAQGIDAAAHRGGLAGAARSIAIVGTGPDRVYPAANRDLAHVLAKDGLILSEFPPGTPARQHHFPRRNRLISGLARGVLVVEAALGSGSLITARMAAEQGREVFAIPGSIHSPFAKGCHRLIRDGAKLVETAQDVLEELKLVPAAAAAPAAAGVPEDPTVPSVPGAVLKALGYDPADVDTLSSRTGFDAPTLLATLSALELDGRVAALPGGRWQRVGS